MNSPIHALAGLITEKFIAASPQAAAEALQGLATHEILQLLGTLKAQTVVSCLNVMDVPKAAAVLRRFPTRQASYILSHMKVPHAARLMKEFSVPFREKIKSVLPPSFVQLLQDALAFPPNSIGGVMHTDFISVRTDAKIQLLVEKLKNLPRKKLPVLCFVVGKDGELKGIIRTAELVFMGLQSLAGSVMTPTVALHPQDLLQTARPLFEKEDAEVLPVTDKKGVLLGFLHYADLSSAENKKTSFWEKIRK